MQHNDNLFSTANSSLCNADEITKRLHRDYGIAMAGINYIEKTIRTEVHDNVLTIYTNQEYVRSVHGDLNTNPEKQFADIVYDLNILYWDIETTAVIEN
jgi:hypothetical protein